MKTIKYLVAMPLLIATTFVNAGLINGSFELPDFADGSLNFPAAIPGWQTTDVAFEVWGTGFLGVPSFDGNQHVELNAFIAGTLFQDVAGISAGAQVGFEFAHRGRATTETMNLTITDLGIDNLLGGGDDMELFNNNYMATPAAWVFNTSIGESAIFALGNTVRFAYSAVGGTAVGNFLDAADFGTDVNVCGVPGTPDCNVPEPGTLVLFGVSLAGLGFARRKKA